LVAESKGALMLVVGRHDRGAVGRALLGSVGNYVVAHATCPVVVVPIEAGPA
jgi:nucleotide-binding universal stress UspA family protein